MMIRLGTIITLLALTSCGTTRPRDYDKTMALTGLRSIVGRNAGWGGVENLENAISAAKKECLEEKKTYEYHSHETGLDSIVKYKCI